MNSETFKVWFQNELNEREWSYRDLEKKAGVSKALTSMVLSDQRKLSWDFCASVAKAFGYSPINVFLLAGLLTPTDLKNVIIEQLPQSPNNI